MVGRTHGFPWHPCNRVQGKPGIPLLSHRCRFRRLYGPYRPTLAPKFYENRHEIVVVPGFALVGIAVRRDGFPFRTAVSLRFLLRFPHRLALGDDYIWLLLRVAQIRVAEVYVDVFNQLGADVASCILPRFHIRVEIQVHACVPIYGCVADCVAVQVLYLRLVQHALHLARENRGHELRIPIRPERREGYAHVVRRNHGCLVGYDALHYVHDRLRQVGSVQPLPLPAQVEVTVYAHRLVQVD